LPEWNTGELDSYLIEITATSSPSKTPTARRSWTRFSTPPAKKAPANGRSKFRRPRHPDHADCGGGLFPLRFRVEGRTREGGEKIERPAPGAHEHRREPAKKKQFIADIRDALYASKIVSYAQGYMLMRAAAKEYKWNLNYGGIALMWRGGCIIRSRFLGKIKEAYDNNPKLVNLLLDDYFRGEIKRCQKGWRNVVATAAKKGNSRSRVQHGAGVLRPISQRRAAGEPVAGAARLFRRAHLRARGQAARRIFPHQLDRAAAARPQQHAPFFVAVVLRWRRISISELAKSLSLAVACGLVPLAGFYFGFRSEMNSTDAMRAICGAWLPLLHSTGLQLPIYQRNVGFDAPWFHVGQALIEFGGLAVIVGICAWRLTRPTLKPLERAVLIGLAGGASIYYDWPKCGHALPLLLVVAAILWWREWRRKSEFGIRNSEIGILWLAFSFFLLAKLGFNPRISHYGVFLAMPAFLSAIYLLLYLLPQFLIANCELRTANSEVPILNSQFGIRNSPFRFSVLIFLLAGLARLTIQSGLFYKDKDFTLGSGGDRIVTYDPKIDPTGAAMASAVAWIETNTAPTNTLAVLPEGVMLNYLTRRDNPTPYVVFAFEVWAFGEQNMLAAYQKNPPDYIVLVQRDTSEYGVPNFGQQKGFGLDVMQWVRKNYEPVYLIGGEPLQGGAFGIKILKRHPL
jgi:hypothetical protein